jgi:glyoxylase-like metal-dependent hydrolase (beta-lactamase superfamily II)
MNALIEKTKLVLFVTVLSLTGNSFAHAQQKANATFSAYERARQVVDAAVAAHGGLETLRKTDKITINYRSTNHPVGQNVAFDAASADFVRIGARTIIDYGGGRYVTDGQSNSSGGYKFNFRQVINPKRSFSIDVNKNRRGNTIVNLPPVAQASIKLSLLTEVPHLLLLHVLDRAESLRYLGEAIVDGRTHKIVSFTGENAAQISLYFDSQTKLLSRFEQITVHPLLGDLVAGGVYSDYQTTGGVRVPRKRLGLFGSVIGSENEYAEIKFDFADGEKLLDVPEGYVDANPAANANVEALRKIGDGVYLIERLPGGYKVMFVEFDDYVMVLEVPTDAVNSQAAIRFIKQTVPNKPIKYVSFSHFHFDHTGGLRQYIAEGATIVVPPGNKIFVEQISQSKFTLKPDTLALKPRPPVIETFEKKRVFTDGKRTVELYGIGATSHVTDMTMFYFPKEKILFQGDMFSPLDQGGIPTIIEINYELVKKVEELKLDVETLIAVHSGAVTWKDFRAAVNNSPQK